MEGLPVGNFFEVTINSNKLYALINEMMTSVKEQASRISTLELNIKRTSSMVEKKSKDREEGLQIEIERVRKAMKEEINYMRLFMRDVDKKATDRLGELEQTIISVRDLCNNNKNNLENDMAIKYSYLQKKMAAIDLLQEEIREGQDNIRCLEAQIEKNNQKIDVEREKLEAETKRINESVQKMNQRLVQTEHSLVKHQRHEDPISRNSFGDVQKPMKTQENQMKSQAFINIMNRIEEVQNNLDSSHLPTTNRLNIHQPRRSLISNNKVTKSGINIASKSGFSTKKESKFAQFQQKVMDKLVRIERFSSEKIENFEKEIYRFNNKAEVVDEHIGILSRKIDKERNRLTEVSELMRTNQDKKVDEKVIEGIKNMIKKTHKDLEQSIKTKMDKDLYERQRVKILDKLRTFNDLIFEKAEKIEVKKGLTFLQDKLKEIIIVLAEQRGSSQDGAIKKTPYKCLSCDKDLQSQQLRQELGSRQKDNSVNLTHYNTSQMRKRIRMVNNTVSTMQFNDD